MTLLLDALLVTATVSLVVATAGYRLGHERVGNEGATVGFGVLAVVFGVLAVGYATSGRTDWLLLVSVATAGATLSGHAVWLVMRGWSRNRQLVTMAAAMLVIALPFEFAPALRVAVQEQLARQVVTIATTLGYQPGLEETTQGAATRLTFENGAYYQISRECTGIEGIALFGGILVGVRTTLRRRLAGVVFMLVAVYVVNMIRMLFVVAALSGNWFGPLVADVDTLQMTYYIAEVAIGQSFVVVASVVGYLWVSQWIPDGIEFASELLDTIQIPRLAR